MLHFIITSISILVYGFAAITGLHLCTYGKDIGRAAYAGLALSITTSYSFAILNTDWLIRGGWRGIGSSAYAWEMTHILSGLSISFLHYWILIEMKQNG